MKKIFILLIVFFLVVPVFNVRAETVVNGDLIRAQGDFDVYIVKIPSTSSGQVPSTKKFKRLVLNPEIFNKYGHLSWDMIKEVESSVLDEYTDSNLVRAVNDDKIYKLYPDGDTGEKRWIKTADDFLDLGFDWDGVYEINSFERDFYSSGEDLVADTGVVEEDEELPTEDGTPSDDGAEPEPEPERDPITINVPGDYSTLQAAIDAAINGDVISVDAGTYNENLVINKEISLIGNYAVSAFLNGQGNGPAITVDGVKNVLIQRFTITSEDEKAIYCVGESSGSIKNTIIKDSGSGIYIEGNCELDIKNNLIFDNKDLAKEQGFGVYIKDSDSIVEIINNVIYGNYHGVWAENSNVITMNSIITNNLGLGTSTGIYHFGSGSIENTFNNVWQNGWNYRENARAGNGSLVIDPRFVQPSQENFNLKTGSSDYSPCLDAGNPDVVYNDTTLKGNLYRNDMGVYGGPDNIGWNP